MQLEIKGLKACILPAVMPGIHIAMQTCTFYNTWIVLFEGIGSHEENNGFQLKGTYYNTRTGAVG